LVFIYYLPIFTLLLPAPHLSYEGHLGGLIGGVACGWIFRVPPSSSSLCMTDCEPSVPRGDGDTIGRSRLIDRGQFLTC
jgi:hypothetical protein